MTSPSEQRRAEAPQRATTLPGLALAVYFYPYIPMLLGIIAIAAGLKDGLGRPEATLATGPGLALAGGVLLFLAGDVKFRHALGFGVSRCRVAAAVAALAAWPVAVAGAATAAIALLTAIVAAALVTEFLLRRDTVNGESAG